MGKKLLMPTNVMYISKENMSVSDISIERMGSESLLGCCKCKCKCHVRGVWRCNWSPRDLLMS